MKLQKNLKNHMMQKLRRIGSSFEAERRLLYLNDPPSDALYAAILSTPDMKGDPVEFRELIKKTPDAQPVFDALHKFEGEELTIQHLSDYIRQRAEEEDGDPLNPFEVDLQERLELWENADAPEKVSAEKALLAFLQYVGKYNKAIATSQRRRADFREEQKLPVGIDTVTSAVKTTLSAHLEGFKNANTQDRMVMLAGIVVSVLVLRGIWNRVSASKEGFGAVIKNVAGITIGGGALWLAYEAANRNSRIVTGRSLHNPLLTDDGKYEEEMDRITSVLRKQGLPQGFETAMLTVGGPKEKKFMAGVAVLSSFTVKEAQEIYEKYKYAGQQIPDGDDWPGSSIIDKQKDVKKNLSPTERFALLEQMGKTMGLIEGGEFHLPKDPNRHNETLLYLITTGID